MTPVLRRIYSESTATKLLPLLEGTTQGLDYEYPMWVPVSEEVGTEVESGEVDLQPVRYGLEGLSEDMASQVAGKIRKLPVPAYQESATGLAQSTEVYVLFVLRGVTVPGYNVLDELIAGSSSSDVGEDIPEALRDALNTLSVVRSVALEEDCDEPTEVAISNAEVVLRTMFDLCPRTYDIYPMSGGEIAIDAGERGRRIGVFCYPDGRMQYVVLLDDEREDIREDGIENIPAELLKRALNLLDS